jgi:hypothetical protein
MSKPTVQVKGVRQAVRRLLCAHKRVFYGPMRDICYDCLAILDEHPNGRDRTAVPPLKKVGGHPQVPTPNPSVPPKDAV